MERRKSRFVDFGIIAALLLSMIGAWFYLNRFNRQLNTIRTTNGGPLRYVGYTFADQQSIVARTSPSWMFWALPEFILTSVPTLAPGSKLPPGKETPTEKLFLWFLDETFQNNTKMTLIQDPAMGMFVELTDDVGNHVFTPMINQRSVSRGNNFRGYSFPAFPRSGKTITANFYTSTRKEAVGTITFPNPDMKKCSEWTPRKLPISQTQDRLTLTLNECKVSQSEYLFLPNWAYMQKPPYNFGKMKNESKKETIPSISTTFSSRESGRVADSEWIVVSGTLKDPSGNESRGQIQYFPDYNNRKESLTYIFSKDVCLPAKAAKIVVNLARSVSAQLLVQDQIKLSDLVMVSSSASSPTVRKLKFKGDEMEVFLCPADTPITLDLSNIVTSDVPFLALKTPWHESQSLYPMARVTNSAGEDLSSGYSFNGTSITNNNYALSFKRTQKLSNWAPCLYANQIARNPKQQIPDYGAAGFFYFFPLSSVPSGKKLNIAILPNPLRKFEFLTPIAAK